MASRALGWSFLSTVLSRFSLMGISITLARMLGPQQFGTVAVAMVALLAILSFNELGVTLAIVRWPADPREIVPTITTISVATSLLLYVALFFSAPSFAQAMGDPAAIPVIRVLGLSVITNGFVGVSAALLERYFLGGRKLIADQVHGWLGALMSLGLVLAGFGPMSLAVGSVAGAAVSGVLIVIFAPVRLRLGFDRGRARQLLWFGLPLAGSSLVVFLIGNTDNLITGHILGSRELGFYVLAWNLASWPVGMFSQPVRSVAPALFSRLQDDRAAMRTGFVSAVGLLGCVTLPVCFLISGAAVPLVGFVYGAQWHPAAQPLVWLALLGALRVMFELSYDYFVVLARSRVVVLVQVAWLVFLIPALIAGARLDGIRGVAVAGFAVAAGVVLPWYLVELRRVGIGCRALARSTRLPLGAGLLVAVAAIAAAKWIRDDFLANAAAGVVTAAVIALLARRMRPVIAQLRAVLARPAETNQQAAGDLTSEQRVAASCLAPDGAAPQQPAAQARPQARPHRADPARQAAGLRALLALSSPVPVLTDITEPMPAIRNPMAVSAQHRDLVKVQPAGHAQTRDHDGD